MAKQAKSSKPSKKLQAIIDANVKLVNHIGWNNLPTVFRDQLRTLLLVTSLTPDGSWKPTEKGLEAGIHPYAFD